MFALRTKTPFTGNAVIYGGIGNGKVFSTEGEVALEDVETFFVETDFGNHMRVSQEQLRDGFVISHRVSYETWRSERDNLRKQPNLIDEEETGMVGSLQALGRAYQERVAREVYVPEEWIAAADRAAKRFDEPDLPDPSCHKTGWATKMISDTWCIGMAGNLDTVHDARLRITGGMLSDEEAKNIAMWIVERYNAALNGGEETMAYDACPSNIPDRIVEGTIRAPKLDTTKGNQPKAWMYGRPGYTPDFYLHRQVFPDTFGYDEQPLYAAPTKVPFERMSIAERALLLLDRAGKYVEDTHAWQSLHAIASALRDEFMEAQKRDLRRPAVFYPHTGEPRVKVAHYTDHDGPSPYVEVAVLLENKPGGLWLPAEFTPDEAEQLALHLITKVEECRSAKKGTD